MNSWNLGPRPQNHLDSHGMKASGTEEFGESLKSRDDVRGYPEIIGHVQIPANRLQTTPGWPSVPANLGAAKAHLSSTQAQLVGASTAGLADYDE